MNVGVTSSWPSNATSIVMVTSADGTATSTNDYSPVNEPVMLPPGETLATVTLSLTDNATSEANESFTVQLSGANVGSPAQQTITILDDDSPFDLTKTGPENVRLGQPITYTLSIFNRSTDLTLTNVVITDVVPTGASVVAIKQDGIEADGLVSWTIPSLPPRTNRTLKYAVVAFDPIVNSSYGARADGVPSVVGEQKIVTVVGTELVGTGVLEPGQRFGQGATTALALADLNNDGFPDAFEVTRDFSRVWVNDGRGNFVDSGQRLGDTTGVTSQSLGGQAVALGDFNDDGAVDALVGGDGLNAVWFNDGDGIFTPGESIPDAGNVQSLVVADVDRDGDLDGINGNDGPNQILFNDGDGVFDAVTLPGNRNTQAITAIDLDDNGLDDLILGNDGANEILFNDGDGMFDRVTLPGNQNTQAVTVGDLNNDEAPDLVFGDDGSNAVLFNDGMGIFTPSPDNFGDNNTQAVALVDVNLDGNLDLLGGNQTTNQIWFNDGSGTFLPGPSFGAGDTQVIVLSDIDQDGDPDVVMGQADASNRVWNNTNKVVVEVGPEGGELYFGQPLTLTVDIPPDALTQTTRFEYTPLSAPTIGSEFQYAGRGFELSAIPDTPGPAFQKPVTVTIGMASDSGLTMADIGLYRHEGVWKDAAVSCNPTSPYSHRVDMLQVAICNLSEFALFVPNDRNTSTLYLSLIIKQ